MSDAAKLGVPPRRYIPCGGSWKQPVLDEQEWLALPDSWGTDKLPEEVQGRKHNLFNFYHCTRLAALIECPVCRPHVCALFTDVSGWIED